MANSYTPPDRSTYDPGWNDPPPMPTMNTQAPVAGKPRTSLNKRVAFPMQSSAASSSTVKTTAEGLPLPFSTAKYQPPPMNSVPVPSPSPLTQPVLPPPPTSTIFNPSAIPPPTTNLIESTVDTFEPTEARQFCQSIFCNLVEKMAQTSDQNKLTEIRKRLECLEQMWQENKLDESAQKNLYQLAKALEKQDTAVAMEAHRSLVTQHINVSTQWATALRQLILSLTPESEDTADNAPAVLSDTEVVQFVDVSTKPHVMDSVLSFPQEPLNVNENPLPETQNTNVPEVEKDNLNTNVHTDDPANQNASKSKFGRFGRILHI